MGQVIFVRHGETEWNRVGKFRGRADIRLNQTGTEQARRVAERLGRVRVNAIYASPLTRTMETAKQIGQSVMRSPIAHEDLLDLDYGDWEGKTPAQVEELDKKRYREWLVHPDSVRIPGGETLKELRKRAFRCLVEHTPQMVEDPNVLVSHDIIGRILVCAVLDLPNDYVWRIAQDCAAITVFERVGDHYIVRAVNDTGHLMHFELDRSGPPGNGELEGLRHNNPSLDG